MKKFLALIFLFAIFFSFCACEKDAKTPPLAKGTLYEYGIFLDNDPESVTFTLEGEFPAANQKSGKFSGSIQVKEANGTKHIYKKLKFCWFDGKLLLHDGKDAFEDSTVLCWVDPAAPEDLIIVDKTFAKPNPTKELTAYVSNDLTDAEARSLGVQINRIAGVQEAVFVSAEAALEEFIADHQNDAAFVGVEPSDLRHRYHITVKTEDTEVTAQQLKEIPGIEDVRGAVFTERIRIFSSKNSRDEVETLLSKLSLFTEL